MTTIIVDKNIVLEPTSPLQAPQLFAAVNNNRSEFSRFLPWVADMRTIADLADYLRNAELLCQQEKEAKPEQRRKILVKEIPRVGVAPVNQHERGKYWQEK